LAPAKKIGATQTFQGNSSEPGSESHATPANAAFSLRSNYSPVGRQASSTLAPVALLAGANRLGWLGCDTA
jgi:hypothetical protein